MFRTDPFTATFQYDVKGDLTSDGRRGLDYDDENQLTRITVTNSWKTEFTYDGLFRRRIRKEFTWQNSTWVPSNEVRYFYDGRLVIQERDGNNLPVVSYSRGSDLSGSRQGAGGIGGLLARTDHGQLTTGNGQPHAIYQTDGNGNITALLNDKQFIVARYEYDPFGNTLSKSGQLADANIYRFSSQEYHQNSGLLLYLYRPFDPNLQRFVTRDPIEEAGGLNLYGFVGNSPINGVDLWGLTDDDKDELDRKVDRVLAGGFNDAQFTKAETDAAPQFRDELEKEFARNAKCSAIGWGVGKALGPIARKAGCFSKA